MSEQPCDGCGASVPISGGIANIWTLEQKQTGGMTLEFDDGGDFFLCFDCIDRLPDYPTAEDVAALPDAEE